MSKEKGKDRKRQSRLINMVRRFVKKGRCKMPQPHGNAAGKTGGEKRKKKE